MTRLLRRAVFLGLVLAAAARLASAERPYDAEVKRLIDYCNRGISDFRSAARSDFKNSRMTLADGTQVDIANYLKDLTDSGKKLSSRYSSDYAAVPEATDFFKRFRQGDDFARTHEGISGAKNEWQLLRENVTKLSAAYGVDWTTDPTTWQPARTTDGPVRAQAQTVEAQSKALGKSLDDAAKAANLDKGRRKALEGESDTLVDSASNLRKAISDGRPAGPAAQSFVKAMDDLGSLVRRSNLTDAVASSWGGLADSAKKLSDMTGLTAAAPSP
jgi:hypothetical protein